MLLDLLLGWQDELTVRVRSDLQLVLVFSSEPVPDLLDRVADTAVGDLDLTSIETLVGPRGLPVEVGYVSLSPVAQDHGVANVL
jgi:hypothetical protein